MYLALQITGAQAAMMGPNASKIFGESGGTIGRVSSNDWVLPDEERFISSRHVIIRFMGGQFSLEDVSTNGTLINGEVGAVEEPVVLKNGDQIQIGEFQIFASVVEAENDGMLPAQEPMMAPQPQYADPVLTSPTGVPMQPDYNASSTIGPVDPLDFLGAPPVAPPSAPAAYSDHSSPMQDYFSPPGIPDSGGTEEIGGIPDDWDLTGFSSPSAPSPPPSAKPRRQR